MMTRIFTQPVGQWSTDVDRLFDTLLSQAVRQPFSQPFGLPRPEVLMPPVNIWEDDQNVLLEAEVPGMTMKDLELFIQDDQITLRGQRQPQQLQNPEQQTQHAQPGGMVRRERWQGRFERTISLPAPVEHEHAEASLHNGVLSIKLPKAASARPGKIEIKTTSENTTQA